MEKSIYRVSFLTTLCMLCMVGLLASDIYLPAMPDIANSFNASVSSVQQTLSIYLFGLAICQLVYGPISDRWGRKKILIAGITIFIFASMGCAVSQSLQQLMIARFCQSLGACAGMVLGRAIAGDLFSREEAAKVFMAIFPVVGASSAISPFIGGYLVSWFDWRACFWAAVIFGLLLQLFIVLFITETNQITHRNIQTIGSILKESSIILKNPLFIGYTLVVCSVYGAYFGYLAESPFIFTQHGFVPHQIGAFYVTLSLSYIIGNLTGRRLLKFMTIDKAMKIGITLFLSGSFSMVVVSLINIKTPLGIILSMSVLTAGNGFLLPLGVASTITLFPKLAGTASGLVGFLQLSVASLAAAFINNITHDNELLMAFTIASITIFGSLTFYFFISRRAYIYA